jgi:protein O-mannosyl-transferase
VIATLALYYPVSGHPFLNYDDDVYVLYNPQVHAGLSWESIKWSFTSFYACNWHPLTWLSHAIDWQVFGQNAGGHHVTSLLLHAVNVLLLFWVLWRATGYMGRSAMVAALFALHPINIESVAWIAERKNLLSMMFFLLALAAYSWYARQPHLSRYVAVAGLYALGLMAKPQVITLPFVLLLWDYWPLQRMYRPAQDPAALADEQAVPALRFSWLLMEKLPLLALSAASAVVTFVAQHECGATSGRYWQPYPVRIENAIITYARYLGKAVWPSHLVLVYPHPGNSIRSWQVITSLLLLLAITRFVAAAQHHRRYLGVGWLWFLGTMVPMIGLVQVGVQAMADRYAYLPFVGLFIMVCWGAAECAAGWQVGPAWQRGASVAVLLALAVTAHRQLGYWSDNTKLWARVVALDRQALQANPNNWVLENTLAHALLNLDQIERAVAHFRAAVAINPADPDSNLNIGFYEQLHHHLPTALAQYEKVIALTQDSARLNAQLRSQAFTNMGLVYRQLGDPVHARQSFQRAVSSDPNNARAWLGIGILAHQSGDTNTAIKAYRKALKIEAFDWGYLLLAQALQQSGQPQQAQIAVQQARSLSQNFEQAQKIADNVLAR